jgi:peptidoglycan/LPS O-acetylase OafA/YrhL
VKQHLPILDGLRGTAAISVVIFHFQELSVGIADPDGLWFRHAYLAVDFFFCLSGYVIGYAYDDRRDRISIRGFLAARLIRLHPMVVLGALLGLSSYVLDPYAVTQATASGLQSQSAPTWKLVACVLGAMSLVPTWSLPNRFGSYVSLNAPAWSLMWEYIANIAYAFVLWRLHTRWLSAIVLASAASIAWCAYEANAIDPGFAWGEMTYGLVRVLFSFCVGLLLFRKRINLKPSMGFGALSLAMLLLFFMPGFGNPELGKVPLNWLYDTVCVTVAFPLIVAFGAGATQGVFLQRLCDFFGRVSYPIYILHYAVVTIFFNYHWTRVISPTALPLAIALLTLFAVAFAYTILVVFDEPLRAMLKRRYLDARPFPSAASTADNSYLQR